MNKEKTEGTADLQVDRWYWVCPHCASGNFVDSYDAFTDDGDEKPQRCTECEKLVALHMPR